VWAPSPEGACSCVRKGGRESNNPRLSKMRLKKRMEAIRARRDVMTYQCGCLRQKVPCRPLSTLFKGTKREFDSALSRAHRSV
jgi:hypothetical protein